MKKLAWVLLAFAAIYADLALATGNSCEAQIKGNREYAQFGVELRKQMLQECGRKTSAGCKRKYSDQIEALDKKNSAAVDKAFPNPSVDDPSFVAVVGRNLYLKMSAVYGLDGVGSAKQIADTQYRLCKGLPLAEPEPRRSSRPMLPMPPPMMPMDSSISPRLSPMQPEMGGGASFGGCNNYNYLGPNGQAVYCQKCCYGDGNCQVICN